MPFDRSKLWKTSIGPAEMINSLWRFQRATPEKSDLTDPFQFENFRHVDDIGLPLYTLEKNGTVRQQVPGASGDMRGGWHDATSTDKDTFDQAMVVANFGMALEHLDDPGERDPVMAEMKWGIDYLLRIQNDDGSFPFQVWWYTPWDKEKIPRHVVVNKGTGVVAGCAYGLAIAARILDDTDPGLSRLCLEAAERAWTWVSENPDHFEISACGSLWTGGSATVLGAAVELYRVTGKRAFADYADSMVLSAAFHNGLWVKESSLRGGRSFPGQFDPWSLLFEIGQVQPLVPLARYYNLTGNAEVRLHNADAIRNLKFLCGTFLFFIQCPRLSTLPGMYL